MKIFFGCQTTFLGIVAAAMVIVAGAASAAPLNDTLFLKDNSIRVGQIVSQDSAYTSIRTSSDLLVISAAEILRIGRERPRDLLLPLFSIYINGGIAKPSQFDFASGVGVRAGGRYMLAKMIGVNLSFTYAQWQMNYDTAKNSFKQNNPSVTETFGVTAVSPRVGLFVVTSMAPSTRLLLGVDVGQTFLSLSSQDTTADTQSGFSYAVRADVRFGLSDRFALMVGLQYESFSTSFIGLENHDVAIGVKHRIGDLLFSAGAEIGF